MCSLCHSGLRCTPHVPKAVFFFWAKKLLQLCKMQYKGLLEKARAKSIPAPATLYQLWLTDPVSMSNMVLNLKRATQSDQPTCCMPYKNAFPFYSLSLQMGFFFSFHYEWVTWKMEDFPSSEKCFQAWVGSQIAIILLKTYLQYCVSPIKLGGNDLQ